MRVLQGDTPVGRPARVTEREAARRQRRRRVTDLPDAPLDANASAVPHCDAPRIVAAVLEGTEPLEYQSRGLAPRAHVTEYSTHGVLLWSEGSAENTPLPRRRAPCSPPEPRRSRTRGHTPHVAHALPVRASKRASSPLAHWLAFVSASPRWFAPAIRPCLPGNHPPSLSIGSHLVIRRERRTWRLDSGYFALDRWFSECLLSVPSIYSSTGET